MIWATARQALTPLVFFDSEKFHDMN